MKILKNSYTVVLTILALTTIGTSAVKADYWRFVGSWSGSGTLIRSAWGGSVLVSKNGLILEDYRYWEGRYMK
jgi:hypothetical protein